MMGGGADTEAKGDEVKGVRIEASDEEWALLAAELTAFDLTDSTDDDDDDDDNGIGDLLEASDEVVRVSRRIAGQYVEVLARFAAAAFGRSTTSVDHTQIRSAIDALHRLAKASEDHAQVALLEELQSLIEPATTGRRNSRSRQGALIRLREWLPRFADTLEPLDGKRLVHLVEWDAEAAPLLSELSEIRGIGPKRLQRLYSAGLFTVDRVAAANAEDIVAVTGIPGKLAHSVVDVTHTWAVEERERCYTGMLERVHRLRRILGALPSSNQDVAAAAARALLEVERALQDLEPVVERGDS